MRIRHWAVTVILGLALLATVGQSAPAGPATRSDQRTAQSAVTPVNRNPARHAKFLKIAAAGNIGLLFVGDSILDFWPRRGPDTWTYYAPYLPADFGVGGERTEDVLWRITHGELDNIKPKVVVLLIGTNNIAAGDEAPWVAAGVQKIVETIRQELPHSKILLLAIFPRSARWDDPSFMPKIKAANALIAKLDDGEHVRYLDISQKFLDANGRIPPELMQDGLHPTAKGYLVWCAAMEPTLDAMWK